MELQKQDLLNTYSFDSSDFVKNFNELSDLISSILDKKILATSPYGLAELAKVTEEQRQSILTSCRDLSSSLRCIKSNFSEKKFLTSYLNSRGWSAPQDFIDQINEEDVVGIHDMNVTQIFRSLNFFKYCGYSLLDLSIYDYRLLWERPKIVYTLMEKYVTKIFSGEVDICDVEIPEHTLREIFNIGLTDYFIPRVCNMKFKKMAAIYSQQEIVGFIVSASGSVVATGNDSLAVDFI